MNDINLKKIVISIVLLGAGLLFFVSIVDLKKNQVVDGGTDYGNQEGEGGLFEGEKHPLSIKNLKSREYPGSDITIEETLSPGSNYKRYIASYKSEGLKIYALLTIPIGEKPKNGYPVIIFNHGYIPPREYKTTERYIAYTDGFSRNGYIVFRSDYRGHGNSEGQATGAYGSSGYTVDILNAVSAIKRLKDPDRDSEQIVDPENIGMWGHSLGGYITLRAMVVSRDIKAGVIWAGVVASYPDLLNNWRRRTSFVTSFPTGSSRGWRQSLVDQYGEPEDNPEFWNSISANAYLKDVSGPIQLHHGTDDTSVPVTYSEKLHEGLKSVGRESQLYLYPGDDHNISNNFSTAMGRSVEFFDRYLKNNEVGGE
ncbi:alpha/beta fold hydrolase [Candidatus Gottesmanbacteria bacterium]|nr:alpha/beta fold hydrolase [Candidatus Gottesmanbacteria bacterium]